MDAIIAWLAADWNNWFLLIGCAVAGIAFVLSMLFPIFLGADSDDMIRLSGMVGTMVSAPFVAMWGLVWLVRGVIGLVRLVFCPC